MIKIGDYVEITQAFKQGKGFVGDAHSHLRGTVAALSGNDVGIARGDWRAIIAQPDFAGMDRSMVDVWINVGRLTLVS